MQESRKNKNGKGWTIKIKNPGPKQTRPGNWKDNEMSGMRDLHPLPSESLISGTTGADGKPESKDDSTIKVGSPLTSSVDDKTAAAFPTSKPLEDKADLVQCKQCKRPVLRHVAKEHIKDCQRKKQEKIQKKKEAKEAKELAARREKGLDDDDDRAKGARKSSTKAGDDDDGIGIGGGAAKKTKKRKAEDPADKGPNAKKKKKDEPKAKAPKTKGPVDVEKQCGVPLPNGAQCARSLTCKSHSMGAKRAVPGRSLPYDMLLAQYQKKNQAKQQRASHHLLIFCTSLLTQASGAAIDANAPLADDFDNHGPVDSDEERDAVMAAVHRARPQPLFTRTVTSTRSKYQYVRLKEMLQNALSGS
ncbi:MAG: SCA7 domain-containing protein, partial [Terriglobus roseus]|nr:SCA7 domain-containing protein [Terriglobus roseus]